MTDDATKMKQERDLALAECERLRADAERLDFVLDNAKLSGAEGVRS